MEKGIKDEGEKERLNVDFAASVIRIIRIILIIPIKKTRYGDWIKDEGGRVEEWL